MAADDRPPADGSGAARRSLWADEAPRLEDEISASSLLDGVLLDVAPAAEEAKGQAGEEAQAEAVAAIESGGMRRNSEGNGSSLTTPQAASEAPAQVAAGNSARSSRGHLVHMLSNRTTFSSFSRQTLVHLVFDSWGPHRWCCMVATVSAATAVLKVTVDSYSDAGEHAWLWVFTGTVHILSWWWSLLAIWDRCRPGLPRWLRHTVFCSMAGLQVLFRCGFLTTYTIYRSGARLLPVIFASGFTAVQVLGSFVLVPLLYRAKAPVHVGRTKRHLAGAAVLVALNGVILVAGYVLEILVMSLLFLEGLAFFLILPTIVLLLINRSARLKIPQGQHVGFTLCLTFATQITWAFGSMFFGLSRYVNGTLRDNPISEGLAQSGVLVAMQALFGLLGFAWDLLARQVMASDDFLRRPVFIFPVALSQLLFTQAFMVGAVFLGAQYCMQLFVVALLQCALQSGALPLARWWVNHKAFQALRNRRQRRAGEAQEQGSGEQLQRQGTQSQMASPVASAAVASARLALCRAMSFAAGDHLGLEEEDETGPRAKVSGSSGGSRRPLSLKEEIIQENTLKAVMVLHCRKLQVSNLAHVASYAAMIAAILAEVLIYELMGQPDCCVAVDPASVGEQYVLCVGRPAAPNGQVYVLRNGLRFQCPRMTGKHTQHNRRLLLLHFAVNLLCFFLAVRLGDRVSQWVNAWAQKQAEILQTAQEKELEPKESEIEDMRTYMSPFKGYLLSTVVWNIVTIFTTIRLLNWRREAW